MKFILISAPGDLSDEINTVLELFENGLRYFHLRKPDYSLKQYEDYLKQIPVKFHQNIIIHNHYELVNRYDIMGIHGNEKLIRDVKSKRKIHRSSSMHAVKEIQDSGRVFNYVFLSPIFGSISKPGYLSNFELDILKSQIQEIKSNGSIGKTEIIALGGMDENNIPGSQAVGFDGVAMLGAIWSPDLSKKERIEKFIRIINSINN